MQKDTRTHLTLFAIWIFALGNLFYCYEFFVQVAPSVLSDALQADFNTNATGLGALSSSFYWSYTIMQIPAGLLLDRYGSRLMLALVTLVCAAGVLLFGIADNIWVAMLGRILMGASGAFAFTGVIYLVIRWVPVKQAAFFIGIIQVVGSIGAIGGGSLLAAILQSHPWRKTMIIFAIVGVIIAGINLLLIRNRPKDFTEGTSTKSSMWESLLIVLKNRETWTIALYSFMIWGPIVAFVALWGVPFLKTSLHISGLEAANAMAFAWIGIAVGSPLIGWASDKVNRRCIFLTISAWIGVVSALAVIFVPGLNFFVLSVILFFVGLAAAGQTLAFGVVKDNNPIHVCGAANGFNNMMVVAGGAVLQPLVGYLLDLHWTGAMEEGVRVYTLENYHIALLILPICFVLAAFASTFIVRETHCRSFVG